MTANLSKLNKFDLEKPFITSSNLLTGETRKPLDLNIDDEKQSKEFINPGSAGFLIETHKNNIKVLNSQYNDLILKKVYDDNLTADQKEEIENKISNILKDIKINENKIDEINKLKSNEMPKILEGKDSNEMPKMLKEKDSNKPSLNKPLLKKLDPNEMLKMLDRKNSNKPLLNKPSLNKPPVKNLDPNEILKILDNNEKAETDKSFKEYYKNEAERALTTIKVFNKKINGNPKILSKESKMNELECMK